MHVPTGNYTLEGFCRTLFEQDESELFQGLHFHQIKTSFYLTDSDDWLHYFDRGYEIDDFGDVTRLSKQYTKRSGEPGTAVFFGAYFEDEILIIFTAATEEGIEQTLEQTVRGSAHLTEMPIFPQDFQKMHQMVLREYEGVRVTEFKSHRIPDLADAEIRPEYSRTIEYKGDDGRQTLSEFREFYGVVPVRVQYEHERIRFKMDTSGKFTLKRMNEDTFTLLFRLIEAVLDHVLDIQEVTQRIRFRKEERKSGDLRITISNVTAGEVDFSTSFNLLMAEEFIQHASSDDGTRFSFTDKTMVAGSLDFSATVTDERRNAFFNISATEDSMTIIPKKNCAFPSLIEFFKQFTEYVDQGASITLFDSEAAYGQSAGNPAD